MRRHRSSSARQQPQQPPAWQKQALDIRPEQVDLLELQPLQDGSVDSLFVRFNVGEVRAVEERASQEADGKRQELRTMVGERYRDLLGAADSIVRMRKASDTLLEDLDAVKRHCVRRDVIETPKPRHRHSRTMTSQFINQEETQFSPFTLATLIKLLLDCPELIWRNIEQQEFLIAARLDALGRVLYQELAALGRDSAEVNGETSGGVSVLTAFPLVEKQWDGLQNTGEQIAGRARILLKKEDLPITKVVEILAAIALIENAYTSDIIDLFLLQRQLVLAEMVANCSSVAPPDLARHLMAMVRLILQTSEQCRTVFTTEGQASPLVNVLEALQTPLKSATTVNIDAVHTITIARIIQSIPNHHILIRYLPPSIVDYAPYIDKTTENSLSNEQVEARCQLWFQTVDRSLQIGLEALLQGSDSASELAKLRDDVASLARASASVDAKVLNEHVQIALAKRTQTIIASQLANLSQLLIKHMTQALTELPNHQSDLAVSALFFEPEPLPNAKVRWNALQRRPEAGDPYSACTRALQDKIAGKTPYLEHHLAPMNEQVEQLARDLEIWLGESQDRIQHAKGLRRHFSEQLDQTLDGISRAASHTMDSVDNVSQKLFLARFISRIGHERGPIASLADLAEDKTILSKFRSAQTELQDKAVETWRRQSFENARATLQHAFDATQLRSSAPDSVTHQSSLDSAPSMPSVYLTDALRSIVKAQDQLQSDFGDSNALTATVVCELATFYRSAAASFLPAILTDSETEHSTASSSPKLRQIYWDLRLLSSLCGDGPKSDNSLMQKVEDNLADQNIEENTRESVEMYMRHARTLLAPIQSSNFSSDATPFITTTSTLSSAPVAPKLGTRFGLLPVPARRK